jgi:hypothetical protein
MDLENADPRVPVEVPDKDPTGFAGKWSLVWEKPNFRR